MVPRATVDSYYGRPVLKEPVWKTPDVPGYLFLGGLAGASSALAACAQLTGNHELARAAKAGAAGAISLSAVAHVHDLGRPARFLNMLRVFKVTSPMSIGSWLLAAYGPVAGAAAASAVTGRLPRAGTAATAAAGLLGPGIATYTAALLCDTAVPAWHDAHREMPYLFAASAASAAGGLGMVAVRPERAGQAVRFAVLGAAMELTAKSLLLRRLGPAAQPYQTGVPGTVMEAAEVLTAAGLAGAVLAGRAGSFLYQLTGITVERNS
jgi:formate-dependent nitrite reductase membrane component NrfD